MGWDSRWRGRQWKRGGSFCRRNSPGCCSRELRCIPSTNSTYQKYDLRNLRKADFWHHSKVPDYSVIVLPEIQPGSTAIVKVALLVLGSAMHLDGVWVNVRYLGCDTASEHKRLQAKFKGKNVFIHLCYLLEGVCPRADEDAIHVLDFEWYPPGEADLAWLSAHGKKTVKEGLKKASAPEAPLFPRGEAPGKAGTGPSVEQRLDALKASRAPRAPVGGAGAEGSRRGVLRGGNRVTFQDGTAHQEDHQSYALVPAMPPTQKALEKEEGEREKPKKRKVGDVLAQAAAARHEKSEKSEKQKDRERSRSASKAKKKKKKKSKKRAPQTTTARNQRGQRAAPIHWCPR